MRDRIVANDWKVIAQADQAAAEQWIKSMTSAELRETVIAEFDVFLSEESKPEIGEP